jgi:hypothetical protein
MKYMLLVHLNEQDWENLPQSERDRKMALGAEISQELKTQGKYLGGAPLHPAETAACIRTVNGEPLLIDGPFAETREQLGGYCLIDVADRDEAIRIARRFQDGGPATIEVRAVLERPK